MSLALTNNTINKFFGFLSRIDNDSKRKLIIKLTESIEEKENTKFDLNSLFGAWEDNRDSDEIINEIIKSRIESQKTIDF
jgi:hypothetical protein